MSVWFKNRQALSVLPLPLPLPLPLQNRRSIGALSHQDFRNSRSITKARAWRCEIWEATVASAPGAWDRMFRCARIAISPVWASWLVCVPRQFEIGAVCQTVQAPVCPHASVASSAPLTQFGCSHGALPPRFADWREEIELACRIHRHAENQVQPSHGCYSSRTWLQLSCGPEKAAPPASPLAPLIPPWCDDLRSTPTACSSPSASSWR
jgi:hypothetical protein